jgi:hypothetical protein
MNKIFTSPAPQPAPPLQLGDILQHPETKELYILGNDEGGWIVIRLSDGFSNNCYEKTLSAATKGLEFWARDVTIGVTKAP